MAIRIALNHKTTYKYDRLVDLSPQLVRLRPAPHCRTKIESYSLKVLPKDHWENWQQDPQGNFLARCFFPEKTPQFSVEVDLIADMTVINPFDFFVEPHAEEFPFEYESWQIKKLQPFLEKVEATPRVSEYLRFIDLSPRRSVELLIALNARARIRGQESPAPLSSSVQQDGTLY